MDRGRVIGGLRIAWSVGFGVLCLLLIALWVRSYYTKDILLLRYSDPRFVRIASVQGRLVVSMSMRDFLNSQRLLMLDHSRISKASAVYQDDYGRSPTSRWFRVLRWSNLTEYLL